MSATERKYNPGFLTDDELVARFCVRKPEFESILEMLRECTGSANQHQIVIGPRGSGKTTLLLRVAAELRRDAGLAQAFFPVVFAEESYEVATAGEFWLECVSRLAGQVPRSDGTPDMQRTFDDLRTVRDDQTLADRCLATVLDFVDRENKRLVLIVENLNMMFRDMADPDAGWRLRHVLQNEPRIVLLASATSRFDEIDRPDHALYDLFRVLTLRPLDTDECAALWEAASGESRPCETVRSLEILTGGSPRLLAIVAHFSTGLSFRQLMDSLLDLVDAHTEYFKSHLEALPAQERRVYLALADLWKPALAKEVADRARTETGKCSAQLARLVERGAVLAAGGTARRKQYYLSERLYNIYYLLRRNGGPNRLVDVLIRFMESYYSPDELKSIVAGIAREGLELPLELRSLHESALRQIVALPALAEDDDVLVAEARRLCAEGIELSRQGRNEDALAAYDEALRRFGDAEKPALLEVVARVLVNRGSTLRALNRLEEALVAQDEVVRRFGACKTPAFLEPVARALVNRGIAFGAVNRFAEALAAFDEALRRFRDRGSYTDREVVARTLLYRGLTLGELDRTDEELAAYDHLLGRFGASEAPALLELALEAICRKVLAFAKLGRPFEVPDVESLLSKLPKLESLPKYALTILIAYSAQLGPARMRELILASPAADSLVPLTTALEREMGLEPRVAVEVEEVAMDIRRELAKLKKAPPP